MVIGKGNPDLNIGLEEAKQVIAQGTPPELVVGKKVLVLTPDTTRTCPLPRMIAAIQEVLGSRAERLDYMIALGSHKPLKDEQILALYGIDHQTRSKKFPSSKFMNHRWDLPETLVKLGTIRAEEIEELTDGLFREAVDVDINRIIYDYDLLVVLGPVFPHVVTGISGGNKYLFPGISGGDFLHFFHWLGAVITSWNTIGYKNTPVRKVLDRAVAMVKVPRHFICLVVGPDNTLAGLYVGSPEESWSQAANLSLRMHVIYKEKSYHTVLGRAPEMYNDIWVAGKVMYKLESVVAEGGRLIIFGPHIKEISHTWGGHLERIGYHVLDYFLKRMERFRDIPGGVLAHSTHVKGLGTYEKGVEKPRIEVILATAIPEVKCRQVNLGYMNPFSISLEDYQNREKEGILYVNNAGEVLHRLISEKQ